MGKRAEGMSSLLGLEVEKGKAEIKGVDPIEEMVGALTDPVIAYPSPWMEDIHNLPLYKKLPLHRLAHLMRCNKGEAEWDEACDLEALLYIYPASLAAPMGEQWTRIYLYLGTKVMGDKFPEDIKQKSLDDYDMSHLRDLKRWIYQRKVKARKERRRQEKTDKAEPKEKVVTAEPEQFRLF